MENTLSVTLILAFLLIGAVGGAVLAPQESEIEYVDRVEYVNNTVTEIVEVAAPSLLDLAVAEFLQAVENEEDEDGSDLILAELEEDYYFDEMEVREVNDEYSIEVDGDVTKVWFSIDLRFDDGDDRDKNTYFVKVVFEDDEDTKVRLVA